MNERTDEERLNDYVDGLLGEDEAREVERNMAASRQAREAVEALRALKARTAELPDSIEPQRDLWPGIAERMAPAPLSSVEKPARRRAGGIRFALLWPHLESFQWATLAAAALLLVVSSSAITAWVVRAPDVAVMPGGETGGAAISNVALDALHPVEAEYALEIAELLTVLMNNRDALDPDTVTTIETNLRVIAMANTCASLSEVRAMRSASKNTIRSMSLE